MEKLKSAIGDKVPEPLRADAASHKWVQALVRTVTIVAVGS